MSFSLSLLFHCLSQAVSHRKTWSAYRLKIVEIIVRIVSVAGSNG